MNFVDIPDDYSVVVQAHALARCGANAQWLREEFGPVSISEAYGIFVIGPLFGGEVCENIGSKLEQIGMRFFDDFFYADFVLPQWCRMSVRHTAAAS
ncbi:hypothetical protein [Roseateles sp. LYH14W]|uniref:Uncharacterized protein n=1 Tax=Pelomonas parva TaxID=3299032 RepID=A0ABW7F7N7_9BURK